MSRPLRVLATASALILSAQEARVSSFATLKRKSTYFLLYAETNSGALHDAAAEERKLEEWRLETNPLLNELAGRLDSFFARRRRAPTGAIARYDGSFNEVWEEEKDASDVPTHLKERGGRNARYRMAFHPAFVRGFLTVSVCFRHLPSRQDRLALKKALAAEIERARPKDW